MGRLVPVLRMVAQRARGHWRLLAAVAAGAVLSCALMSSVVLYSDAVRDLGLKHALETAPRFSNDVRITSSVQLLERESFDATRATTGEIVERRLGPVLGDVVRTVRSATFFPTAPGEAASSEALRPRANLWVLDELDSQVRLVEGRPLSQLQAANPGGPPTVAAWVVAESATVNHIAVGYELDLYPFWRKADPVRVVVVGIVEPLDRGADYWMGEYDRYVTPGTDWPTLSFFVDETSLVDVVAGYLPDIDGTFETFARVVPGAVNSSNAGEVRSRVADVRREAVERVATTRVETALDTTIAAYEEKLFFTRLPLFALMIQVTGVVLFYLVMVSTMVVERQLGEIALLRSRGASVGQVMLVFVIEGLAVVGAALAAGPFLAAGAIASLGLTPAFADLSGGELMHVRLSQGAVAMSALGGVLSLGALLWPAFRASRLTMTNYKQQVSRPPSEPVFFRYYLDLGLIVVAALAFYRLRERGSFVTDTLFEGLSADPVLLATPSLFMLMVALIFLRLFPLVLRMALRLSARLSGATVTLALTRLARSPLQHSRLMLLLILSTAVGMFAAGFRSTLERGYEDRAAYRAGAEGRIADIRSPLSAPLSVFVPAIERAAESTDVSAVIRLSAGYSPELFSSVPVTILGVDAASFAHVAYWRSDFGPPPGRLLGPLESSVATPPRPIAIPADARYIGVWAQVPLAANALRFGVRLLDSEGSSWDYRFQPEREVVVPGMWQFFIAELGQPSSIRPSGVAPDASERVWVVDGFYVQLVGQTPGVAQHLSLVLDDLQVASAPPTIGWGASGFAGGSVIESFEAVESYQLLAGVSRDGDPGALSRAPAPPGRQGSVAQLSFIRGRGGAPTVAFRVTREDRPLAVVVDSRFLADHDFAVGDEFTVFANSQYVTVRIAGAFKLFPSFDPADPGAFMVADREALQAAATRIPGVGGGVYPNEAWLGSFAVPALTSADLLTGGVNAQKVFDREAILVEQSADPLIAASWEGILFLSFAAVLLVSALGFVVYSGIGALGRSLEFAILRTMGLGGRQILGVVTLEHAFVVVAGVAAGTLLGFPLSRLMITYMGLTERGAEPLPPLVSVVSWQTVLTVYALLSLVVVATVAVLVSLYSRLAVSRALRMGEL